jgi:hypothetical protein
MSKSKTRREKWHEDAFLLFLSLLWERKVFKRLVRPMLTTVDWNRITWWCLVGRKTKKASFFFPPSRVAEGKGEWVYKSPLIRSTNYVYHKFLNTYSNRNIALQNGRISI